MNTKIRKINSRVSPVPSRAQYGPATAGVEFDSAENMLFLNPDGTKRKVFAIVKNPQSTLAVNGAINPRVSDSYIITKAGILADTLAAPTVTTDDGLVIRVTSNTANAHTITATSLLNDGVAGVPHTTATFAAFAGAYVEFRAYQGKWMVGSSRGVTIT